MADNELELNGSQKGEAASKKTDKGCKRVQRKGREDKRIQNGYTDSQRVDMKLLARGMEEASLASINQQHNIIPALDYQRKN